MCSLAPLPRHIAIDLEILLPAAVMEGKLQGVPRRKQPMAR
jgi:hypothetical protein